MPIAYTANPIKLRALIAQLRNGRLGIPDHQRDFCWSLRQQKTLVDAIQRGKPIPSILRRELDDGQYSLEDGRQRLETCRRYMDDLFADKTGRLFSQLTPLERERWENYDVVVTTYSGATDEEAREIFNDTQNGKPLSFGERIGSMAMTAPIVRYAIRMLLTPGEGLYDAVAPFWGEHTQKGGRGAAMTSAFALCAGLAFGPDYTSRKWDDAVEVLHRDFDEVAVTARLNSIVEIYTGVTAVMPATDKAVRDQYWDLGNFTGYIAFSLCVLDTPELASSIGYELPDRDTVIRTWISHLVAVRTHPGLLWEVLHRDMSSARSWNKARWSNGVRRLFAPTQGGVMEDSEDEDDA